MNEPKCNCGQECVWYEQKQRFSVCCADCNLKKAARTKLTYQKAMAAWPKKRTALILNTEEIWNLWSRVDFDGPIIRKELGPCWEWTSTLDKHGYGLFGVRRRQILAHRSTLEIHLGEELGDFQSCHHCDNPKCVRPSHLFKGTNADNQIDSRKKGRAFKIGEMQHFSKKYPERVLKGEQIHTAVLTEEKVREIRNRHTGWRSELPLSLEFGVSRHQIYMIVTKRSWRHVS